MLVVRRSASHAPVQHCPFFLMYLLPVQPDRHGSLPQTHCTGSLTLSSLLLITMQQSRTWGSPDCYTYAYARGMLWGSNSQHQTSDLTETLQHHFGTLSDKGKQTHFAARWQQSYHELLHSMCKVLWGGLAKEPCCTIHHTFLWSATAACNDRPA